MHGLCFDYQYLQDHLFYSVGLPCEAPVSTRSFYLPLPIYDSLRIAQSLTISLSICFYYLMGKVFQRPSVESSCPVLCLLLLVQSILFGLLNED